jgi:EmrB/QacA subfamily drug resistance transporter
MNIQQQNNAEELPLSQRRAVLLASAITSFLTPFVGSSLNVALPAIGREFHADAIALGWLGTTYLLAAAMFMMVVTKFADRTGRRKVFLSGTILFTVCTFVSGLVPSIELLLAARFLNGIAAACIFATGIVLLTSAYPPEKRGRVLGLNVAAVYAGGAIGPSIGGFLTHVLGWRSLFFTASILGLCATVIVIILIKHEWKERSNRPFDTGGAIISALSFALLIYGLSAIQKPVAQIGFTLGLAGLVWFFFWEKRVAEPLINMSLFTKNITFALSNFAAFINYGSTFAIGYLLSFYLQFIRGYDAVFCGKIMLVMPLIMAIGSPLTGRLSDRIEPRILVSCGMIITTAGLFFSSLMNHTTPLVIVIAIQALIGLGLSSFSSPNNNAIMGSVEKRYLGAASAILAVMRLFGQMVSMAIAVMIMSFFVGNVHITQEVNASLLKGIRISYLVFGIVSCLGIVASLKRGTVHSLS